MKVEKVQLEQGDGGTEEVGRLREEVEILRGELHRAEVELEDRCWMAPTVLQHWLQLTYELESLGYNNKRKSAELQMEQAKDACEKLKRKRSSLVGAFVSTHGRYGQSMFRLLNDTNFCSDLLMMSTRLYLRPRQR